MLGRFFLLFIMLKVAQFPIIHVTHDISETTQLGDKLLSVAKAELFPGGYSSFVSTRSPSDTATVSKISEDRVIHITTTSRYPVYEYWYIHTRRV